MPDAHALSVARVTWLAARTTRPPVHRQDALLALEPESSVIARFVMSPAGRKQRLQSMARLRSPAAADAVQAP